MPVEAVMEEDTGDFYYFVKDAAEGEKESLENYLPVCNDNVERIDQEQKMYKVIVGQDDKAMYLSKLKDLKNYLSQLVLRQNVST